MSEHTEAGKECIARVVHELVPTIERDFWQDDPHNGDVRQHLYFWIEGEPDAYRIAFMSSSLNECAHPHNTTVRHRVEAYIRHKVSAFFARKSVPCNERYALPIPARTPHPRRSKSPCIRHRDRNKISGQKAHGQYDQRHENLHTAFLTATLPSLEESPCAPDQCHTTR